MYQEKPLLPQRTTSPVARRLHAQLHDIAGYHEAYESPRKVAWTLGAIMQLSRTRRDLPIGLLDAVDALQE